MKTKPSKTVSVMTAAFLLSLFISTVAFAEESARENPPEERKNLIWGTFGFGLGDTDMNSSSISGCFSLSLLLVETRLLFSVQVTSLSELNIQIYDNEEESPEDSIFGVGPLIGVAFKGRWGYISFSGGLSYVSLENEELVNSSIETSGHDTLGFPLETQLFFTPSRYFGIGVVPYFTYTLRGHYWGINVCIQVGRLYYDQ